MPPKKRVRQFRSCPQQRTPTFIEFTDTPTRQFPQKKKIPGIFIPSLSLFTSACQLLFAITWFSALTDKARNEAENH